MLLNELMEIANINISLSEHAKNIEIDDDFSADFSVSITDTEITITRLSQGIVKTINFNFDKNTISEVFISDLGNGGIVYSIDGNILKIIN